MSAVAMKPAHEAFNDLLGHARTVTGIVPYLAYSRDEIEQQDKKLESDPEFQRLSKAFTDAPDDIGDDITACAGRKFLVSSIATDTADFKGVPTKDCVTATRKADGRTWVLRHAWDWRLSDNGIEARIAEGAGIVCENYDDAGHACMCHLSAAEREDVLRKTRQARDERVDAWMRERKQAEDVRDLKDYATRNLEDAVENATEWGLPPEAIAAIRAAGEQAKAKAADVPPQVEIPLGDGAAKADAAPVGPTPSWKPDPNKEWRDDRWQVKLPLRTVCAADLAGKAVPVRKWIIEDWIPDRNVTLYMGDGAVGKSLAALQLAVAVALTGKWLGMTVTRGPVIYFSAEDEMPEMHRRLADICRAGGIDMDMLTDLHIVPLAGLDALLATFDRSKNGAMVQTPLWKSLIERVEYFQPKILILDTLADVYGGSELDRIQVRSFVGLLRGTAFDHDLGVVLLGHPSVAGMATGTGTSGSTGWNNTVRSRLYQERVTAKEGGYESEPDTNLRTLRTKKANYSARGSEIRVRWANGVFVREGAGTPRDKASEQTHVDTVFMELLCLLDGQDRYVSSSRTSKDYAPSVFSKHAKASGVRQPAFVAAMDRLFDAGKIVKGYTDGPPSRRKERLCVPTDAPERDAADEFED